MKIIQWENQDVYSNLALEEYVFFHTNPVEDYYLLWQSHHAVVIGKHQNPIEEINIDFVNDQHVQVARRLSGGGTVYHDLGNLNYSIIAKSEHAQWDIKNLARPIAKALRASGVDIQISKRNDLLIDGKKISGSAQYIKGKRLLHHGTLLFHSDLHALSDALRVGNDTVESRSIKSIRSEVTNICDHYPKLSIPEFTSTLMEVLREDTAIEKYGLSNQDLEAISQLRDEKYSTWEWIYGRSPEFSIRKVRRINGKDLDISLVVKNGMIQALEMDGDFGEDMDFDEIVQRLIGEKMLEGDVIEALALLESEYLIGGIDLNELARVIVS